MNNVVLFGRVVKDVELFKVGENLYTKNTIAIKRAHQKDKTDFINFVIWGKRAETFATYVKKGDQTIISGEININETVDPQTQQKKYFTEIRVNNFTFVSNTAPQVVEQPNTNPYQHQKVDLGNIPNSVSAKEEADLIALFDGMGFED